ncbi:BRISC and BRCA1-A complex member 2-like [Dysidea avara]|uniref:BRISC and BRCA1-A complex member 2-like n=1 Tax=Dysidea avara TaxID=196820 RepID=UPI0033184302
MESNESVENRLHPQLWPLVKHCLANENLLLHGGLVNIKNLRSSAPSSDHQSNCDRFTITVPYCTVTLECEVLFDYRDAVQPPDVILGSNKQLFSPQIETIRAFHEWDINDESSLSRLIEEILKLYRDHQQVLVSSNQRLQFELNSLIENTSYTEVDVWSNNFADEKTIFLIPLNINFTKLPAYITKDNPGNASVALVVSFFPPDGSRVIPTLAMSPAAEKILTQPKIPPWGTECGSCLMDYVPGVGKHLEEMVSNMEKNYTKRQEYIAAMLSYFGRAVLEYDIESYMHINFLFDYKRFSLIVILELSDSFPQKQPVIKLRSIYHRLNGQPCQSVIDSYPYSPRWNTIMMVEKLRDYLIETIPKFMELSLKQGKWIT